MRTFLVQVLEVLGEVVDPLRVEKLSDHVAGLHVSDGGQVLLDGIVVVALRRSNSGNIL